MDSPSYQRPPSLSPPSLSPTGLSRPGLSRRALLAGTGGAGLLALLAACNAAGPAPSPGGPGRRGGILRAGSPPPPTAVDPVTMYDGSAIAIVQLVAEYLIWLDQDLRLVPRLARSWSASPDQRRWTFRLRPGVTFSDGTPVDAAAVVASFDRLLEPANKSAALAAFKTVLSPGGVHAVDAGTVAFTLDRPFSDFPYLVSAGNYNAVILKPDHTGDFVHHPIGSGPFTLTSYDAATGASFARNERYWDPGKPYLDGVEIKFYADDQADLLALESGDIDTQLLSRPALAGPLASSGVVDVDTVKGTGVTVLTLRVDRAPFDRKEVRQAVAYGLGRPDLLQSIGAGVGDLGNDHLLAPLFPAAPTGVPQRVRDPRKVAELLQAAGLPELSFTLTFDPPSQDYAVTVQNQLRQVGITVHLDQRSSADFYGGDQERDTPWLNTQANLVVWAGRPVPSQLVTPMVKSGGVWNGSKYANPALDAAADAYDRATTDAGRRAAATRIAQILHEDVPIIVTYWAGAVRAYDGRKFTGIHAHPSSYVDFSGVSAR
jgi:peptide/nickel transport system substrate-binding protein